MSAEEDIELRDLVAQTLEINGCLSKIRVSRHHKCIFSNYLFSIIGTVASQYFPSFRGRCRGNYFKYTYSEL